MSQNQHNTNVTTLVPFWSRFPLPRFPSFRFFWTVVALRNMWLCPWKEYGGLTKHWWISRTPVCLAAPQSLLQAAEPQEEARGNPMSSPRHTWTSRIGHPGACTGCSSGVFVNFNFVCDHPLHGILFTTFSPPYNSTKIDLKFRLKLLSTNNIYRYKMDVCCNISPWCLQSTFHLFAWD